jgi:hypothetical protein
VKSNYLLHHVGLSACNNSAFTERIFNKFDIWVFFENLLRKFKFHYNLTRIMGTLHVDQYTFVIISHPVHLRMRNVWDRFIEKIKTHILCSITFFRKLCHLWDNVEEYKRTGQATGENMCMHIAWWIPKTTNTMCITYCFFHCNNGCTNAPQCYVLCTLLLLYVFHILCNRLII